MRVNITKPYKYAPEGHTVVTADPGPQDLPEFFAKDAITRGYGKKPGPGRPPKSKESPSAVKEDDED